MLTPDSSEEELLEEAKTAYEPSRTYAQQCLQIKYQKRVLEEQRSGNRELVNSTKRLVYATIAVAVATVVIGFCD